VVLEWDERSSSEPDSTELLVSWNGLSALTDARNWLQIVTQDPGTFGLFKGGGVIMSNGVPSFLGDGVYTARSESFATIAESPWNKHFTRRLDSLTAQSSGFLPREWFNDTYSLWAAETTPVLLSMTDSLKGPLVVDAVAYLRNWDYSYDRASIAASIFNVWAEVFYELEGRWPGIASRDAGSNQPGTPNRGAEWADYLEFAVARLATDFGSDMSTWRWERVHAGRLRFPVLGDREPSSARFVPTVVSGIGHPSTPAWGPPAVYARLKPHGFWEGWTVTDTAAGWIARRIVPDTDATFRGSSASIDVRRPVAIGDVHAGIGHTTTLRAPT
ncbi:MAG: penicillin acylase family protein, partial [Rhodothermia bacterium]|nr:penicillin acylase family protein [Rhodothermia bacterium]